MAVGKEVDSDKMDKIPSDGKVIETDNTADTDEIGEKIIKKVVKGTFKNGDTVRGYLYGGN